MNEAGGPTYAVRKLAAVPSLTANWEDSVWAPVETVEVSHFLKESSSHRPRTSARLAYTAEGLHGMFKVEDRYIRCVRSGYFAEVWKDSAVEFFFQPRAGGGYFNLECNCGGSFLICHITDPRRTAEGFRQFVKIPPEIGLNIKVRSSLPERIDPEIASARTWTLQYFIPLQLVEQYMGPLENLAGQVWRGNFFKCAEEVSHPHWAAWSAVDEFNFHLPRCFGSLRFE